jgi:hypothetical protein
VAQAFNLAPTALSSFTLAGTPPSANRALPFIVATALLVVLFFVAAFPMFPSAKAPALVKISAPAARLPIGSSGKIDGQNYTVVSDTLVEINAVGVEFQRHEFHLRDQDGNGALLIHGWKPGEKDWCLLVLRDPSEPMTPPQAAAIQYGQTVPFAGTSVPVDALFRSVALKVDTTDILQNATGKVNYGFSGTTGVTLMLARWDESSVNSYGGHMLHEDPTSAFAPPVEK